MTTWTHLKNLKHKYHRVAQWNSVGESVEIIYLYFICKLIYLKTCIVYEVLCRTNDFKGTFLFLYFIILKYLYIQFWNIIFYGWSSKIPAGQFTFESSPKFDLMLREVQKQILFLFPIGKFYSFRQMFKQLF